MNYQTITYPDVNNGLGCRVTLWVSGCHWHCKGCHNPETWDPQSGRKFTFVALSQITCILSKPYMRGLTISGGEPLDSLDTINVILEEIKRDFPDKDIWLYTGYVWEDLDDSKYDKVKQYVDVIVDGLFQLDKRDTSLAFRGSTNQRIIDVKKSVETNSIVTLDLD